MSIQLKLLSGLLLVASIFTTYYAAYRHGISVESDRRDVITLEERIAIGKGINDALTENDQIKTKLEAQHAKDTKRINDLRTELDGYRVHLPPSACPDIPDTSSGSADGITGTGTQPNTAQDALNHFTDGLKQDAYIQDGIIESCRVVMEWAKAIGNKSNGGQ